MISVMQAPNGNPLQYSCLKNPMDRGAWWATVQGIAKEPDMTYQLNNNSSVLTFQLLDWVLNSLEKRSF